MSYKVGIVGESNYQSVIARCEAGDDVTIAHEIDNAYDEDALVVLTSKGERIGYIGRSSWVRALIHEEGRSCQAIISFIKPNDAGLLGVVLSVVKDAGPVKVVSDVR